MEFLNYFRETEFQSALENVIVSNPDDKKISQGRPWEVAMGWEDIPRKSRTGTRDVPMTSRMVYRGVSDGVPRNVGWSSLGT